LITFDLKVGYDDQPQSNASIANVNQLHYIVETRCGLR
jgi:hypothetical protein